MTKTIYTNNYEDTIKLGYLIGQRLVGGDVVLLDGDLGAGKTTFTKGIGKALGVSKVINSPTFTIVKEYNGTNIKLYHLDLYRLDGVGDDFDLEEYFSNEAICVCEWPFQAVDVLPVDYLMITIKRIDDNKREFTLDGRGKYDKLVGDLNV
ncbi:MAG: tRNA (adenosine(37)-N6)-threonylcarbamoyltransferase complex ATPase subunit type 1 TsaE [Anaeroplasmataceae bacterium]